MSEESHLTTEFRQRAVDAVLHGMTKTPVAVAYGVDRKTISRWVNRFQEGGGNALLRRLGSGRPRKLEDVAEEQLEKRIASKEVIEFLGQMLRHHKHRHLIVVMDRAPPHTSKKTRALIDSQPR
jgi:transposase